MDRQTDGIGVAYTALSIVSRSKIGRIPDSPEPKSGATLSKSDNDVLAGGIESLMLSVPVKEFSHSEWLFIFSVRQHAVRAICYR